jgi:hypothetical protein
MNRKQFSILIVLGVLVGGLGLYLYNRQKESYAPSSFQTGAKVIKDFPLNDIAHLRIKQGTNEVNLVRAETWNVKERYGYPANFTEIHDFLRKVWELKPVQDVEVGKSQYGRLQLISPTESQGTNSGTLVEFKDAKDATVKSIVLGKKTMKESQGGMFGGGGEFPVGRYVLVPENPPHVWLVNETFSSIDTKPEQWLNKDFFKVEKVKSVSVAFPDQPTNNWSISRETENGEWKLADVKPDEKFENSKASSLNYALSSPSFNDVASPDLKPEETGMANPTVAKLETFEGFLYTVSISGKTNEDNHYLKLNVQGNFAKERAPAKDEKPEDKEKLDKEFKEKIEKLQEKLKNEQKFDKWTYLVSKWSVDSLLKERKDFLAEKKDEKKDDAKKDSTGKPADAGAPPFDTIPPEIKNLAPPPPPTSTETKKPESTTEKKE